MAEKKVIALAAGDRLQIRAVFWHLLLFLLPGYAVWQGLLVRWQAWFSLILWALLAIFFLFFVGAESLTLKTPKARPARNFAMRIGRAPYDAVFGNDKGRYLQDDDGVTIEDYWQNKSGRKNQGKKTTWDWSESYLTLEKDGPEYRELLRQYFREHWHQPWQAAYPAAGRRGLMLVWFWLNVLWLPVSYWLFHDSDFMQRGGFVRYGQPAWGSLYALLVFANLSLPLLANQVGSKLQRSLSNTKLDRIFAVLLELGYSLASLLAIGLSATGPAAAGAALLLLAVGLYLRLLLRRKISDTFPLFLLRQLGCFNASLGLVLAI